MIKVITYHPHHYLRNTLVSNYKECISCKNRTQFICIKCNHCYSCHWKIEKLEKIQSEPLERANSTFLGRYSSSQTTKIIQKQLQQQQQQQQQLKIIDVFGKLTEPICNYHKCNHKFSIHGRINSHICKCHHPRNYATGVSIPPNYENKGTMKVLEHRSRHQKHLPSKDKGHIGYYYYYRICHL